MGFYSGNPKEEVVTYFESDGDVYVPPILDLARNSWVYGVYKSLGRFLTIKLDKLKRES